MSRGKYQKKLKRFPLRWMLICVLLLVALIGGASAYLSMSASATNSLTIPQPTVSVDGTKVTVTPNGCPVYLRIAVDGYWEKDGKILAEDYNGWSVSDTGWEVKDGFYYYHSAIESTTVFENVVNPGSAQKDGYQLVLTVAAQIVQAVGETDEGGISAVYNAWGVNLSN